MAEPPHVPPAPPESTGAGQPAGKRRVAPGWLLPALLVAALVAASMAGVTAYRQRQEIHRLRAEVADAHAEIARLETRLAEAEEGGSGGGLGGLLDDLLGGGLREGGLHGLLDRLLDGLLDGTGGRDDLLGGADVPALTDCLGAGLGGLGADPIPTGDRASQLAAVTERVEALRALELVDPVDPQMLSGDAFSARLTALVSEEYPEADADADRRVLTALGAVEEDVDLRALRLDLIGEHAGGFYSSDTGELVVRADDDGAPLTPAEQVILAHELQHAVADQTLGLPLDGDTVATGDPARAALALIEGDASLLMQQFALDALDFADQLAVAIDPSVTTSRARIGDYPEYLQRELVFPYTVGMAFVCGLYAEGGWPAVDAAYTDLPTTTAQILWPERYTAGEAAAATAALGAPGGAWTMTGRDTLGAAELLWLFSAPGNDPGAALGDPRGRAAAWAGGSRELWIDGDDSAVGLALAERPGERALCASMTDWYDAAFPDARRARTSGQEALAVTGPDQDAVVVCDGSSVRVGIAPDLQTARTVAG